MDIKYRSLVIVNTVTLIIMLLANYFSSFGFFSESTVAEISEKYNTLFAPAGYAFIIWGLIFLMCIGFVVYQWIVLKDNKRREYIESIGSWFAISNMANTFWLFSWTDEKIGWSVVWILLLLVSLCVLIVRLRLELDDEPVRVIVFIWWPIAFYLGWVLVATIACIASWFVYMGWHGGLFSEDVWTIIMILIACLLYTILIWKRNLRESASVGIWAFIAIAIRQWHTYNNIAITAIIAGIILMVAISIHGYKNRYYMPSAKLKRHEW